MRKLEFLDFKAEDPKWLFWLKLGFNATQLLDRIIQNLDDRYWDENVQRHRRSDGRFAHD